MKVRALRHRMQHLRAAYRAQLRPPRMQGPFDVAIPAGALFWIERGRVVVEPAA